MNFLKTYLLPKQFYFVLTVMVPILLVFLIFGGAQNAIAGQTDFFSGKKMTIIVPYGPGGGFDTFARVVAPHLKKYIPLSKVFVKNVDGGGGLIGTNEIFQAKPDGLTVGIIPASGSMVAQLMDKPGVQYKMVEWSWIARASAEPHVMVLAKKSKYKNFNDMKNAKTRILFSTEGVGDDDHYGIMAEMRAFGIPFKLITGYKGSKEPKLAIVRGEVDAGQMSFSSALPMIQSGDFIPVIQISHERDKQLLDVPTGAEVADTQKVKDVMNAWATIFALDRTFAGPPSIPTDRLNVLRDAFEKVFKSDEFNKDITKRKRFPSYMNGAEIQKLVNDAFKASDTVAELLKQGS